MTMHNRLTPDHHVKCARLVAVLDAFDGATVTKLSINGRPYSSATAVVNGTSYDVNFGNTNDRGIFASDIVESRFNQ